MVESSSVNGRSTAAQSVADQTYSYLIQKAVELCHLSEWTSWTSNGLIPDHRWYLENIDDAQTFGELIISAFWPRTHPKLEAALMNLSIELNKARNLFLQHATDKDYYYRADRFYKTDYYPEEIYRELSRQYEEWESNCYNALFEATRAANWFAEVVREEFDPQFFYTSKFAVRRGVDASLGFRLEVMEYSEEQKKEKQVDFS